MKKNILIIKAITLPLLSWWLIGMQVLRVPTRPLTSHRAALLSPTSPPQMSLLACKPMPVRALNGLPESVIHLLCMPQHCGNAQKVAEYLSKNEKVAWVNYCGLPDNKYYTLAQKYMPNGSCGVISFGLKGGRDVSIKFMDSLEFIAIVTHVADARSCVLHPASHTHRQLSDEQLMEAGVRPDLIRLSVGIENADDIIADIEQALNA